MIFFSGRRGGGGDDGPNIDDAPSAVLAVAVSAMVGDGEINDAEVLQLGNICALSPIFRDAPARDVNTVVKQLNGRETADFGYRARRP